MVGGNMALLPSNYLAMSDQETTNNIIMTERFAFNYSLSD